MNNVWTLAQPTRWYGRTDSMSKQMMEQHSHITGKLPKDTNLQHKAMTPSRRGPDQAARLRTTAPHPAPPGPSRAPRRVATGRCAARCQDNKDISPRGTIYRSATPITITYRKPSMRVISSVISRVTNPTIETKATTDPNLICFSTMGALC